MHFFHVKIGDSRKCFERAGISGEVPMRIRYGIGIIIASGLAASLSAAQEYPAADALKLGKQYVSDFYRGDTESLWKNMTPRMQTQLNNEGGISKVYAELKSKYGEEASVENERVMPAPHAQTYIRAARFTVSPAPMVI